MDHLEESEVTYQLIKTSLLLLFSNYKFLAWQEFWKLILEPHKITARIVYGSGVHRLPNLRRRAYPVIFSDCSGKRG